MIDMHALALRIADLKRNDWMIRQGKTHSVIEIPRPWPQRSKLTGRYWPAWLIVWRKHDTLSVTFYPWLSFRRWAFTRCEGCGGRFRWSDGSVTARHESHHRPRTRSLLFGGETGRYHMRCADDQAAEYAALDGWDRSFGHDDAMRRDILGEPIWIAIQLAPLAEARRDAERAYRTRLVETRREAGLADFAWHIPKDGDA